MKNETKSSTADLQGHLFVFPGRILFLGHGLHTDFHSHHASSLLISMEEDAQFGIMLEEDGPLFSHSGLLINPGKRHRLLGNTAKMLVLQVVPEMYRFPAEDLQILDPELVRQIRALGTGLFELDCDDASRRFFQMIELFHHGSTSGTGTAKALDPRIAASLDHIHSSLPEILSIHELAIGADLSEHRFMHLFKKQVGIPVRRYALWARMQKAAFMLKDGRTLTEAAHEAGFSDSAHMSRSFKELFGITPSAVFGDRASVSARFCNQVWNQENRS